MKKMKCIALAGLLISLSSCGAICGGKITDCQKNKPAQGNRQVRAAALIGDLFIGFFPVNLAVDFATGGIYKPCKQSK